MKEREKFGTRIGFILVSAGCAVGLGNVWKFPYITGQYGGAAFILIYLLFLVILGLPIMIMEFAVGRGSQKSAAESFNVLGPKGTKWGLFGYIAVAGNYLLMMFYTMVGGWMLYYCYKAFVGGFRGLSPDGVGAVFGNLLASPWTLTFWTIVGVVISFGIVSLGLKNGVEKITTVMMVCLLSLMIVLAVRAVTLNGATEGLDFYLKPDFGRLMENGLGTVVFAAMGQAFFTLSIGMGSMAIFGSYLDRDRSLTGEAINITILDTVVALLAGLIVIPSCFAFGVEPGAGPGLIFITLPNIFNNMVGGHIWGALFFLFLSFAALTTIVAVFENIVAYGKDLWGWDRKKSVAINIVAIVVLSMPCILGFNVLSDFQPLGEGTNILDLEDFIVSNNILPLGSLIYLMFCTYRYGWGWDNFMNETNMGTGLKFPKWSRIYVSYILPLIILFIFFKGYYDRFLNLTSIGVSIAVVLVFAYIVFMRDKSFKEDRV